MSKIAKLIVGSIKKHNFFWTEINKNVTSAEYAIKG